MFSYFHDRWCNEFVNHCKSANPQTKALCNFEFDMKLVTEEERGMTKHFTIHLEGGICAHARFHGHSIFMDIHSIKIS